MKNAGVDPRIDPSGTGRCGINDGLMGHRLLRHQGVSLFETTPTLSSFRSPFVLAFSF